MNVEYTSDMVRVVHGHWVEVATDIVCSNCKAAYDTEVAILYRGEQDLVHYSGFEHCPHCGAKMDVPACGPDYCEI